MSSSMAAYFHRLGVDLTDTPDHGRGVFAQRDIPAGTIVSYSLPVAVVCTARQLVQRQDMPHFRPHLMLSLAPTALTDSTPRCMGRYMSYLLGDGVK